MRRSRGWQAYRSRGWYAYVMRRPVAFVLAVFLAMPLGACAPEVVRVDGASRTTLAPDGAPPPVCGSSSGQPVPGTLLSAVDVWPNAGDVAAIASDTPLTGVVCRRAVLDNVAPSPVSCSDGFPFFGQPSLPTALAGLGVTDVRQADLVRVGPNRTDSAQVTEYVLTLAGPAAAGLEALAVQCEGSQLPDVQPPVYTIRDATGEITDAVRLGYDVAVGLSFAGHEFNDATKLALLTRAVDLASFAPSG
ncbi:MAG TPA: hypothetical protein VFR11_05175 [Micromonosporaceae bacterium]|nr:hypothetical protein [Micromonosporaceae bacterium]